MCRLQAVAPSRRPSCLASTSITPNRPPTFQLRVIRAKFRGRFIRTRNMAISTRLTEQLGVTHPVMLAPMDLVADGKLAATVSRAGGFGVIGAGYGDEAWLTREMDAAGDARIGGGFITWSMAEQPRLLDLGVERQPAAGMLSFCE